MDTTYIICYRNEDDNQCLVQPSFTPMKLGSIGGMILELLEVCSRVNLDARLEHWKQTLDSYNNGYNLKRE